MSDLQDQKPDEYLLVDEIPERLDEQHVSTTKVLGFLVHPNIKFNASTAKIADIGCGSGAWLFDMANSLPSTSQLVGFDLTSSALPAQQKWPPNVSFRVQDMYSAFPVSEIGTYDVVSVRFTSSVAARAEWARAVANIMKLLKPGGWLQWIDSCNFALYNSVAGTSRAACMEIYDGLEPFRNKADAVIGLFMRESKRVKREEVFKLLGLIDVQEDVFSTDRIQDPDLHLRDKGTRNILICFLDCLRTLVGTEESSAWTLEKIAELEKRAMKEVDAGVYHTLDQVCIIGRKADASRL